MCLLSEKFDSAGGRQKKNLNIKQQHLVAQQCPFKLLIKKTSSAGVRSDVFCELACTAPAA
jgi:hypothetical protein